MKEKKKKEIEFMCMLNFLAFTIRSFALSDSFISNGEWLTVYVHIAKLNMLNSSICIESETDVKVYEKTRTRREWEVTTK